MICRTFFSLWPCRSKSRTVPAPPSAPWHFSSTVSRKSAYCRGDPRGRPRGGHKARPYGDESRPPPSATPTGARIMEIYDERNAGESGRDDPEGSAPPHPFRCGVRRLYQGPLQADGEVRPYSGRGGGGRTLDASHRAL